MIAQQVLNIVLAHGQSVRCEPGTMMHSESFDSAVVQRLSHLLHVIRSGS